MWCINGDKEQLIKYIYLGLGVCFGVILQSIFIMVEAQQNVYCDFELFVFGINNNLEVLENCINAPNEFQDMRIELLQNQTITIENRLSAVESKTR